MDQVHCSDASFFAKNNAKAQGKDDFLYMNCKRKF